MSNVHHLVLGPALILALALGCSEGAEEAADSTGATAATSPAPQAEPIPEVSVAEAARLFAAGEAVPVDANGANVRQEHGVVPGARLLTSSGRYDPSAELPQDQSAHLVFYCGNSNCRASDGAAARAREAGFEHVNVMREGIAGWVAAGQTTEQPAS